MYESNNHAFTSTISSILEKHFGEYASEIFSASPLIGYLNKKTKSANKGSKSRASFANHYALYVIVEDYISKGFADNNSKSYSKYGGARFTDLFNRQRELPFGAKLQNHALNSRLNDEFRKFYPSLDKTPILRDPTTQRYWVQEDLLIVRIRSRNGQKITFNIAYAVIEIIDEYVAAKRAAFDNFLENCKQISRLGMQDPQFAMDFVLQQLSPNVDARIFEIISYAVLKAKYQSETIWIGETKETVSEESIFLYKTGRTNANDGGIDFVMKPIGRFFQVTEDTNLNKFFLDIDKVQKYPITFVIKSTDSTQKLFETIKTQATKRYGIEAIVEIYMNSIEEIINIDELIAAFNIGVATGQLQEIMNEIILQSTIEFNYT